ncbi:MAG TPA: carboxypeptidase-like regulatory domain-containing protein [Solirubrobacteraceae bacterium]|nr:carboxypeptidase-like regulatory domain-containing protein [Solirubrobacteraceae bacterium]
MAPSGPHVFYLRLSAPQHATLGADGEITLDSGVLVSGKVFEHRQLNSTKYGLPPYDLALASVVVQAVDSAGGARVTALTDATGTYRLSLPPGSYTVSPTPSGKTDRERYQPASATVVSSTTAEIPQDFRLISDDRLLLSTPYSRQIAGQSTTQLVASGTGLTDLSTTLQNARGDSITNWPYAFTGSAWIPTRPSGAPRLIACDENWKDLDYPNVWRDRTPATTHVFLGSDTGTFSYSEIPGYAGDYGPTATEYFSVTGTVAGPDRAAILGMFAGSAGQGPSTAALQSSVMEQLAAFPTIGRQLRSGDFGPIFGTGAIVGSHTPAGVVFYAHGNSEPLLAHLFGRAPLPSGYPTIVVPITWDFIEGVAKVRLNQLQTLSQWEKRYGTAAAGFAGTRGRDWRTYFGGPYPPAAGSPLRVPFDTCAPIFEIPTVWFEDYSPVRLMFRDGAGHRFGYDSRGRLLNQLAGIIRPGHPTLYGIPVGSYAVTITGTARGAATLVVRTPSTTGEAVSVFTLAARKGANGTLTLTRGAVAQTLRFGGRTIRAHRGVAMRMLGIPKGLKAGTQATLALQLLDQFKRPVPNALLAARATDVSAAAATDRQGRATLRFRTPGSGRLTITATAPAHETATATIAITR